MSDTRKALGYLRSNGVRWAVFGRSGSRAIKEKGRSMAGIDITPDAQGKVRDLYDLGDRLLLVATDRISAFDYILEDEIPYKGQVLTQLSKFWFDLFDGVVENHLISTDVADLPEEFQALRRLSARSLHAGEEGRHVPRRVHRARLPGRQRPEGVSTARAPSAASSCPRASVNSSKLPEPIFTPSTKAEIGDHDENISLRRASWKSWAKRMPPPCAIWRCKVYTTAADHAAEPGASSSPTRSSSSAVSGDTIILADEVLTPDSSRFWPGDTYEEGKDQPSFDKQFVRDWLTAHWDKTGNPPRLAPGHHRRHLGQVHPGL